ncbi:MAG: RNA polymerase sigma-70 factor [Chitinophagales bacterium]|nr:RNA polymerase sigma-70 factor [Chitinophagales bacterium]
MQHTTPDTEQAWLIALAQGDETALRHIFKAYYRPLLADAWRLVPDRSVCEDLVQEVFVELWRKREELSIHSSLRAYLRRAVVNRAINHLKSDKRFVGEEYLPQGDTETPEAAQEQALAQEIQESRIHEAIAQLPEKCRVVFVLSRFEHKSHKEIAEILDISTKTIENQITKAMKMLREFLIKPETLSSIGISAIVLIRRIGDMIGAFVW